MNLVDKVGALRVMFALLVLISAVMSFYAGGETVYDGWMAIPTIVTPALVVLLVWLMLFDMLMSTIFLRSDDPEKDVAYRKRVLLWNTALIVICVIAWGPFYYGLVN